MRGGRRRRSTTVLAHQAHIDRELDQLAAGDQRAARHLDRRRVGGSTAAVTIRGHRPMRGIAGPTGDLADQAHIERSSARSERDAGRSPASPWARYAYSQRSNVDATKYRSVLLPDGK